MKKNYNAPEAKNVILESEDIITFSFSLLGDGMFKDWTDIGASSADLDELL